jgi:hypothetical protein
MGGSIKLSLWPGSAVSKACSKSAQLLLASGILTLPGCAFFSFGDGSYSANLRSSSQEAQAPSSVAKIAPDSMERYRILDSLKFTGSITFSSYYAKDKSAQFGVDSLTRRAMIDRIAVKVFREHPWSSIKSGKDFEQKFRALIRENFAHFGIASPSKALRDLMAVEALSHLVNSSGITDKDLVQRKLVTLDGWLQLDAARNKSIVYGGKAGHYAFMDVYFAHPFGGGCGTKAAVANSLACILDVRTAEDQVGSCRVRLFGESLAIGGLDSPTNHGVSVFYLGDPKDPIVAFSDLEWGGISREQAKTAKGKVHWQHIAVWEPALLEIFFAQHMPNMISYWSFSKRTPYHTANGVEIDSPATLLNNRDWRILVGLDGGRDGFTLSQWGKNTFPKVKGNHDKVVALEEMALGQ